MKNALKKVFPLALVLAMVLSVTGPFAVAETSPTPPPSGVNFNSKGKEFMLQTTKTCASSPCTVEAWVNLPTSLPNATRAGVILGNYSDSASGDKKAIFNFEIYTNGNPRIYWGYNDSAGKRQTFDQVFSNVDVRKGRYVHVAIVVEAAKLTCYVDGQAKQSINVKTPTGAVALPHTAYVIGNDLRSGGSQYFKGSLADVRVWSGIRGADDIRAGMYEPNTTVNLMGRWKLWDRESNGVCPDTSSSGNNAYDPSENIASAPPPGVRQLTEEPMETVITTGYLEVSWSNWNVPNWELAAHDLVIKSSTPWEILINKLHGDEGPYTAAGYDWIVVSSYDPTYALNDTISVTVVENTDARSREGKIKIKNKDGNEIELVINQPGRGYTVTYNGNGNSAGNPPLPSKNIEYGTQIFLPSVGYGSLGRTGYLFIGWHTSKTATAPLENYTVSGNVTMFAVWEKLILSVTPSVLSIAGNGETKTFSIVVNSGAKWSATASDLWLGFGRITLTGAGTQTVKVSVGANTSTKSRTGTITVANGSLTKTITVTQAPKNMATQ